ncbi:Hsp20/alpha crystallin family protein [Pleionea sediminis]|uniref:Hsp20/alpha crystallin family protein n=1 Tax=Pleionea sediminis TaxID=2569479 RepID=UPI001184F64A|nr:Hsp20/alpha crystallin family protein [Pleionea sediminis]
MSLMKYQPWSMFDQLHKEINDIFDRQLVPEQENATGFLSTDWKPAVDIKETDKAFLIKADIPGVKPEDIDVSSDNGYLVIKGQRKQDSDETKEGVHRVERSYGSFYRSFALPDNVDVESISAKSNHGVLELTLPKTETASARRIKIGH